MNQPAKAIFIASLWPEKSSSAAGHLIWKLMELFNSSGQCEITYACSSQTDSKDRHLNELRDAGVKVHPIAANDDAFDAWIAEQNPTYVIFDRFPLEEQFGWRVRENSPRSLRILNTVDLHFVRRGREKELKKAEKISLFDSEDAYREVASILRCDLSLLVSEFEMKLLQDELKISPALLHLYRPPYPISESPFEGRRDFAMIGNFMHPPNRDAVQWVKKEIWPLIRKKIPQASLDIYGAYPDRAMTDLNDKTNGFHIRGWAENARETLARYRVTLAPLRYGAGYKGKIIESWSTGTPCITTAIGVEGLEGDFTRTSADSAGAIAQMAIDAYNDATTWSELSKSGLELVRELFSENKNQVALWEKIKSLDENLPAHRSSNFLGEMLWHHSLRSTEYFSRWITAKNKLL